MSIKVALVLEPKLDLAIFVPAAQHLTGDNPVRSVDAKPGLSNLIDQIRILENFTEFGPAHAIAVVGFLVAGPTYQINEFIEFTGGMAHISAKNLTPDARALLIAGTIIQWQAAIIGATSSDIAQRYVRGAFNDVMGELQLRGLGYLFDGFKVVPQSDSTLLLRHMK